MPFVSRERSLYHGEEEFMLRLSCDVWFTQRLFVYIHLCELSAHRCYTLDELREYFTAERLPDASDVVEQFSKRCAPITSSVKYISLMALRMLGVGHASFAIMSSTASRQHSNTSKADFRAARAV